MTHGLTGAGVVVPGEQEHEIAIRAAALEPELALPGSVLGAMLVRHVAIASIRVERAMRHESALAAERMRRAGDVYNDERQRMAELILAQISLDPATARRRLMAAPEGIDVLTKRLRELLEKAEPQTYVAWDEAEGNELDHCLGFKPGQAPMSRVGMLTRGIMYDHWVGLDPAEFADKTPEGRVLWAIGSIHAIITAELTTLEAHRATLDPARPEQGRAEAPERSLIDLEKEGLALRRYANAAERTIAQLLKELRLIRYEAQLKAMPPAEATETLTTMLTEIPALKDVRSELASFGSPPQSPARPASRATIESMLADPPPSFVPITVGRTPGRPRPPGS